MRIKKLVKDDQVIFIIKYYLSYKYIFSMTFIVVGEYESPNIKSPQPDIGFSSSSEVFTSDMEEDLTIKNSKDLSKKHSSRSIFITEDDASNENVDNFNEENYLSWVSHSKGIYI